MRVRTLLLTTLLFPGAMQAQTIRGIVVEYGTRSTIAGATIEVTDKKGVVAAATSDSSGYFTVYPRAAGRMTVRATHPSFTAMRTDTVTAAQKELVTLIVRMASSPIAIEPIVVTARSRTALNGFYERKRRNAFGTYIDEQEIQRKRPVSVEHLMRGRVGVDVERTPEQSSVLMLRGCLASVYVDGLPIAQGPGFDIDDLVPIGQLAAVEIYRSEAGVPFEFMNIGNQCGSVVFWTNPIRESMRATWKVGIAVAVVGAIVLAERIIAGSGKADISDRPMRAPAGWQDTGGRRPTVRIQVPLPWF